MTGLRIDVSDLLAHPGSSRTLALEVSLPGLAGTAARVDAPLEIGANLERIPDGIVARGTVRGVWTAECSEGLERLDERFELTFDELFEPDPVEGETYPVTDDTIDLDQLVRDVVLLELPLAPTCATGHPEVRALLTEPSEAPDPRWAALSGLELKE